MINAYCFYQGSGGWASHAKGLLGSLRKFEEIALVAWDAPLPPHEITAETREMLENSRHADPSAPCLGIGSIEFMPRMPGLRRKSMVLWEPSKLPDDKVCILQSMEELWTPSEWGRALLSRHGIAPERIFVVPGGVDAEVFRPLDRAAESDRPFRFLCVGKWENRKNIGQLVDAFGREFRAGEPVELVLHCFNPYLPHLDIESEVRRLAPQSHAPIRISHPVAGESMVELYNSCDVFSLPARAEGWGLPIVEAMACGLPAIVTNYSAPTDYLTESNGYPLRVAQMVDVYDPYFYPTGWDLGQWAEPDLHDLRRLLRHVFEHPAEVREKGQQARADVCRRWTWDHAAATAYCRLRPERFAAHAGAE